VLQSRQVVYIGEDEEDEEEEEEEGEREELQVLKGKGRKRPSSVHTPGRSATPAQL